MRRQIVSGAFDDALRDELRELLPQPGRVTRGPAAEPRRAGPEHDRRHIDRRALRQPPLHVFKPRLARRIELPVPIGMHDDVDEIGIVERRRGARVGFVGVLPFRRPRLPEIANDVVAIRFERPRAGIGAPGAIVFCIE